VNARLWIYRYCISGEIEHVPYISVYNYTKRDTRMTYIIFYFLQGAPLPRLLILNQHAGKREIAAAEVSSVYNNNNNM